MKIQAQTTQKIKYALYKNIYKKIGYMILPWELIFGISLISDIILIMHENTGTKKNIYRRNKL